MESPPQYGSGAVYGISIQLDERIKGSAPNRYLDSCAKTSPLSAKAKFHHSKIVAIMRTKSSLKRSSESPRSSGRVFQSVTLPVTLGYNTLRTLYHVTQMGSAVLRRNFQRDMAEQQILDEVLESLSISLEAVLQMLARLGLETRGSLLQHVEEGEFHNLATLGRLLEAFASRHAPPDTIYLASGKVLLKEHCSGLVRLHFDQIHQLKDEISLADLPSTDILPNASQVFEQCLKAAWRALQGAVIDRNNDRRFLGIVQVLRDTRDELPHLIIATAKSP